MTFVLPLLLLLLASAAAPATATAVTAGASAGAAAEAAAGAAGIDTGPYHSGEELESEFRSLARDCKFVTVSEARGPKVALTTVRVADPAVSPARHRVLMFFGEHARELIATETALVMARALCGRGSGDGGADGAEAARKALAVAEFLIFPNCNPEGRLRVERGEYCVRSNERGVDLNRNWNDHWQDDAGNERLIQQQSFGGKRPFSETETVILKRAAVEYRPTIFMTVHSGTLGIFVPYAWNGRLPTSRAVTKELMTVIDAVNKRYCRCSAGPAGKEVGYLCPGTCLDWMYDKLGTRFSYGFEVYGGDVGYIRPPGSTSTPASLFLEEGAAAAAAASGGARANATRLAARAAFPPPPDEAAERCLKQFNPVDEDTFRATTRNWALALIDVVLESDAANDPSPAHPQPRP